MCLRNWVVPRSQLGASNPHAVCHPHAPLSHPGARRFSLVALAFSGFGLSWPLEVWSPDSQGELPASFPSHSVRVFRLCVLSGSARGSVEGNSDSRYHPLLGKESMESDGSCLTRSPLLPPPRRSHRLRAKGNFPKQRELP